MFLLTLALFGSLFINCSTPIDDNHPEKLTGSLKITLPGTSDSKTIQSVLPTIDDIVLYRITISCPENFYQNELEAAPGTSTIVSNLLPGNYTISMKAFNGSSQEIFHGSAIVTVLPAETAIVIIQLEYTTGAIEIIVNLPTPPGPITPTPTSTEVPSPSPTPTPTPTTPASPDITIEKNGTEYLITINARNQDFEKSVHYYEEPLDPLLSRTSYFDSLSCDLSITGIEIGDTITFQVNFIDTFHLTRDVPYISISLSGSNASVLSMYPSSVYTVIQQGDINLTVGNAGIYATSEGINGFWLNMGSPAALAEQALSSLRASFQVLGNIQGTVRTAGFERLSISTNLDGDTSMEPSPFAYGY